VNLPEGAGRLVLRRRDLSKRREGSGRERGLQEWDEDEARRDAMLDAYVIEEIRRRERDKGAEDRPVIELPLPIAPERGPDRPRNDRDGEGDRGVVIIDYSG
jgi:hypothetical protein